MKFLLLLICTILMCVLPPAGKNNQSHPTLTSVEKVYIAPIVNNAHFQFLPGWPKDAHKEDAILSNITNIRKHLNYSIKSSECSERISVVESSDQPSMRISVVIKSATINGDSLHIPLQIEIERISDGMIKSYSINSSAFLNKTDLKKAGTPIERLFADYFVNFPYSAVISFICPH